jgi:hypothetical protein
MKSVVDIDTKKSKKRKAKTNVRGQSQEQRMLRSKQNDPLYQASSSDNNNGTDVDLDVDTDELPSVRPPEETRVYSTKEASNLGRSVAGRREWQARHKKGKFNQKQDNKNAHRVKGTFSKAKKSS